MAGRYIVTGVQLGMLLAINDGDSKKNIIKHIQEVQFVGNSENPVEEDCKKVEAFFA